MERNDEEQVEPHNKQVEPAARRAARWHRAVGVGAREHDDRVADAELRVQHRAVAPGLARDDPESRALRANPLRPGRLGS
jgi:hypothetical protein